MQLDKEEVAENESHHSQETLLSSSMFIGKGESHRKLLDLMALAMQNASVFGFVAIKVPSEFHFIVATGTLLIEGE